MQKWNSKGRLLLLVTAALCAVLIVSSCEDNTIYEPTWHISGTVTDSLTGQPVDSVGIEWGDTLSSVVSFTDSNGTYTFEIPSPNPRVFARKEGYLTKWVDTSLTVTHTKGVDFQLTPN